MKPIELQKWREAHPGINITDNLIAPIKNFPSLYANDLADKLSIQHPDISSFIRELGQECAWSYGNWSKAQHDADQNKLLRAIYDAAGGAGGEGDPYNQYGFVRKFLVDYAVSNNLPNPAVISQPQDDWSERLGLTPLGTTYESSPNGTSISGSMQLTDGPQSGRAPEPGETVP